jgi:hypothetical protein
MKSVRQTVQRSNRRNVPIRPVLAAFLGVFCVTCQKSAPASTNHDNPANQQNTAAVAAVVAPPAAQSAAQQPTAIPASACAGQYKGTYTVATTRPAISRKEGAPAQWESDDGHALSGPGELALAVDNQNVVSGTAKGALGQQTLRGSCDDQTLRVQLDSVGTEPNLIQNAFILADLSGDQATGTLTAATGDSLVRRSGAVNLRKSQ